MSDLPDKLFDLFQRRDIGIGEIPRPCQLRADPIPYILSKGLYQVSQAFVSNAGVHAPKERVHRLHRITRRGPELLFQSVRSVLETPGVLVGLLLTQ